MDYLNSLHEKKKQLQNTKTKLEIEINTLYKEIDQVENDAFGAMNKIKLLIATQISRGAGMEAIMGDTYVRLKRGGFKDAREFTDHLKSSIEEARGSISKINQIIINLENLERDYHSLDSRLKTWLDEADKLLP